MKKVRRSFFTPKNLKVYEGYHNALFNEISNCKKVVRQEIEEYKERKRSRFQITGTPLSLREMLIIAGLFMDSPRGNLMRLFSWGEAKRAGNGEYLYESLKKAEDFLKQIPGAVIPERPVALEPLFKEQ